MRSYIIRRILLIIPTFIVVSMIIFLILRLIPGSVIDTIAAQYIYLTNLDKAAIEKALGLNVPIYIQYFRWMGQIFLHGNFGKSFVTNLPVVDDIKARWPITFELGIMALLIGQLIALPVGIYSAMRQDTVGDYITRSIAILCIAVPDFWVATMVIVFPSIWWHYTPSIMLISFGKDPLGEFEDVYHTGARPRHAIIRDDDENDAHDDVGSTAAGLHPDRLGKGIERKGRNHTARAEERIHSGSNT